jgi:hypothetical protein
LLIVCFHGGARPHILRGACKRGHALWIATAVARPPIPAPTTMMLSGTLPVSPMPVILLGATMHTRSVVHAAHAMDIMCCTG